MNAAARTAVQIRFTALLHHVDEVEVRARDGGPTKAQLYRRAKAQGIEGRSKMSKRQLENALGR